MTAAELDELRDFAARVPCPKPPRGCGQPIGEGCVNQIAARPAGGAPRTSRVPHPARIRLAENPVPEPRQDEAVDAYDDECPF